jgi:hypothetical protein
MGLPIFMVKSALGPGERGLRKEKIGIFEGDKQ